MLVRYNQQYVLSWYCTCSVGARIVGSCCHIASIIWYLSFGNRLECVASPGTAKIREKIKTTDEINEVLVYDSYDDEDEE